MLTEVEFITLVTEELENRGFDPYFCIDAANAMKEILYPVIVKTHQIGYSKGFEDANHLPF